MPAKRSTTAAAAAAADVVTTPVEQPTKPTKAPRKPAPKVTKTVTPDAPKKERKTRATNRRPVVHEVVNARSGKTGVTSPRTTVTRFTDRSSLDNSSDVKVAVNSLASNLNHVVKAAMLIGENGSCTINGTEYTKKNLNELSRDLTRTVKRLPGVCRQAGRRRVQTLTPDEAEKCRTALEARVTSAAGALASACDVPQIGQALREKGNRRVESRLSSNTAVRTEPSAIEKPFFISDPFRRFVGKGEFGNGWAFLYSLPQDVASISGAENPDAALTAATAVLGFNPAKKLGLSDAQAKKVANPRNIFHKLLVELGIATSPILMSLMSVYINANGLRDPETNRIRVDETMAKFLGKGTNTGHVYAKKDFTPEELKEVCKLSGLERLAKRESKGDVVPFDGKTFTRPMNTVLANYYRISHPSEENASKLNNQAVVDLCNGVKLYL